MELSALKDRICASFHGAEEALRKILVLIEKDNAIFPFNEYEYLISSLINQGGLSYQQYLDIRTEFISANPNLYLFEISSPRGFGEKFAQTYLEGKCSKLVRPSKKIDLHYTGEYDFWLDGIRIEVKASRAVDANSNDPLYMKALSRQTEKSFLMNFQQLKPQCCDVFIWVAVFRDQIVVWVIGSQDVANHPLYARGQHRGNHGNEGQLHVREDNIHLFDGYELKDDSLEDRIRQASQFSAYNERARS